MLAEIIHRIEERKGQIANAAMQSPGKDQSDVFLVAGQYQGLQQALDIIHQMLVENQED